MQFPGQPVSFRRTRIAPTPSGYLHLGNALSFTITAALAERYGAKILLRIDDLDFERTRPEYIQDIFDTLEFLEIPWHEGPRNARELEQQYSQRHRLPQYAEWLNELRERNLVFACDCSRSVLQQAEQSGYNGRCSARLLALDALDVKWRIRTEDITGIVVPTLDGPVDEPFPAEQHDFVVRKKDGFPSYQLASVVDDVLFDVDLIVRGADLKPSTLAQLYLAKLLRAGTFLNATFHHHELLLGPAGQKLSKSAGDTSIRFLRRAGKAAKSIFNLLAAQCGCDAEGVTNWRTLGDRLLDRHKKSLRGEAFN